MTEEKRPIVELQESHPRSEEEKKTIKSRIAIPKRVFFLIVIAMIMTSFASIFIRLAGINIILIDPALVPADASVIAFWRLLFATIGMFLGAIVTRNVKEFAKVNFKRDMPLLVLSGFALAVHFATWNLSLQLTTVANSITIVYLLPLFTLGLSIVFLKEQVSWWQSIVLILTVGGAILVGIFDLFHETGGSIIGDLFALAGGFSGAVYFVIGRKKREKLDVFSYATIVYGICTLFLLTFILAYPQARNNLPLSLSGYHFLFYCLLAIGPSCLGHTLYNYSLGFIRAPVITVTALGEMFGATILAIGFFQEIPHWSSFIGMMLVAAGIVVTVILENKALKKKLIKPIYSNVELI